jgi:hypothetical protein
MPEELPDRAHVDEIARRLLGDDEPDPARCPPGFLAAQELGFGPTAAYHALTVVGIQNPEGLAQDLAVAAAGWALDLIGDLLSLSPAETLKARNHAASMVDCCHQNRADLYRLAYHQLQNAIFAMLRGRNL